MVDDDDSTYIYNVKADVLIYLSRPLDSMGQMERTEAISENVEEAIRLALEGEAAGSEWVKVEEVPT